MDLTPQDLLNIPWAVTEGFLRYLRSLLQTNPGKTTVRSQQLAPRIVAYSPHPNASTDHLDLNSEDD